MDGVNIIALGILIAGMATFFGIGWYSLRHTRNETDYWIAGGKLGWAGGGATLAATHTSAGTFIGTIGVMYTVGWSFGWLVLSIPLAYWFTAAVLAPRFTRVRELTLPAFLEARYQSKGVRALAAVVILVATALITFAAYQEYRATTHDGGETGASSRMDFDQLETFYDDLLGHGNFDLMDNLLSLIYFSRHQVQSVR